MSEVKTYRVEFVEDRFSKWMSKDDHDRVVAQLRREVEDTEKRVQTMHRREDRHKETIAAQAKELETARLVIEKLKERRNNWIRGRDYQAEETTNKFIAVCDAELAALTKQPEPKEGV